MDDEVLHGIREENIKNELTCNPYDLMYWNNYLSQTVSSTSHCEKLNDNKYTDGPNNPCKALYW